MSDPKQVVELTTKPDANITHVLAHKLPEIMAVAAPSVKADGNWITRAKLELLAKPDVAALMTTKKGVETALVAIIRAATVGINFGGTRPQAYFVPTQGGVRLDVSQHGYAAAAVNGPGAVLSQIPELIVVHQNDGLRIDQGTGRVIFPEGGIDPFADRGKLVGWVMRLDFKDGRQSEVRYIDYAKVRQIGDTHGQLESPAYKKDRDQQDEKIAVKQLLKRVFAEAEGRSQMSMEALMDEPEPVVVKDRGSRLERQMGKAAAGMKAAEPVATEGEAVVLDEEAESEGAPEDKAEPGNGDAPYEELFK